MSDLSSPVVIPNHLHGISRRKAAFSLVEVVVAVGIFAIAVISVIGLLSPINKSIADVRETDEASRVITVIQAELQRALATASSAQAKDYKIITDFFGKTLYASRSGHKIGEDSGSVWGGDDVEDADGNGSISTQEQNAQKFFEFKLIRNDTLSPSANDDKAGYLAFTIELRWPGYSSDGRMKLSDDANAHDQQSVLIVPAAITR